MIRSFFIIIFSLFTIFIYCQQPSYSFGALNFNNTARTAALGGYAIAIFDNDALLNSGDCSNQTGELLVGSGTWIAGEELAIVSIGSIDNCSLLAFRISQLLIVV